MLFQPQQDPKVAISTHRLNPGKFRLLVETGRDLDQCSLDGISQVECKVADGDGLAAGSSPYQVLAFSAAVLFVVLLHMIFFYFLILDFAFSTFPGLFPLLSFSGCFS